MSFGHAWEMRGACSDAAWARARRAARLAFESLEERVLWGPLASGQEPPWERGDRPSAANLGVWLMLNSPPARAGLDGALESEAAIEALPGGDDWMAYAARLDRRAKSGMVSTGAKLHDLVIVAALCAIEAQDPGLLWIRHTDGDEEHWRSALSWLRRLPGCPPLFAPFGAPGHQPGAALAAKEREELLRLAGLCEATREEADSEGGSGRGEAGKRSRRSRARKA